MTKTSLILGGNGALGRAVVKSFKESGWKVLSMDITSNTAADNNVIVDPNLKMQEQAAGLLQKSLEFSNQFNSIICVAGGFEMGSIKDTNIFE